MSVDVKEFNFPSFEKLMEMRGGKWDIWDEWIGVYHAVVCISSYSTLDQASTYAVAIANAAVPTNVYVRPEFSSYHQFKHGEKEAFKKWYEETITEANDFWKKYVIATFIKEE